MEQWIGFTGVDSVSRQPVEMRLEATGISVDVGGHRSVVAMDQVQSLNYLVDGNRPSVSFRGPQHLDVEPSDAARARDFVTATVARLQGGDNPLVEDTSGYTPPPLPRPQSTSPTDSPSAMSFDAGPPPVPHNDQPSEIPNAGFPPPANPAPQQPPAHGAPQPQGWNPQAQNWAPPPQQSWGPSGQPPSAPSGATRGNDVVGMILDRPSLLRQLLLVLMVGSVAILGIGGLMVVLQSFDASNTAIEPGDRATRFLGGSLLVIALGWAGFLMALAVRFIAAQRTPDPCSTVPFLGPIQMTLVRSSNIERLSIWFAIAFAAGAFLVALIALFADGGSPLGWLFVGFASATMSVALGTAVAFIRSTVAGAASG